MPNQTHLQIADHLITSRLGYEHHGIYIGDGCVVHYSGSHSFHKKGVIELTSLESFASGKPLYVASSAMRRFTRDEIRERALSRLGETNYHLIFNNCEHFANWAIDGEHQSEQVRSVYQRLSLSLVSPTLILQLRPRSEHLLLTIARNQMGPILTLADAVNGTSTPDFLTLSKTSTTVLISKAALGTALLPITGAVAIGAIATYTVATVWAWFWD